MSLHWPSRPQHPHVPHPKTLLAVERRIGTRINEWVARVLTSVLGSMTAFWLCFLVPQLTIPASDTVKLLVGIVFSSWFQAWALPVLQGSQNRADALRNAKADADHQALAYIASAADEIKAAVAKRTDG